MIAAVLSRLFIIMIGASSFIVYSSSYVCVCSISISPTLQATPRSGPCGRLRYASPFSASTLAGRFAVRLRRMSPPISLRFIFGSSRSEPSLRSPIRVHEAREVIAAYADGADFDYVISRLAPIGEKMAILLA